MKTAAMCEHGSCTERWTACVDLGGCGWRFVCDEHVDAVVREAMEPTFEAMGVAEYPKRHLEVVR